MGDHPQPRGFSMEAEPNCTPDQSKEDIIDQYKKYIADLHNEIKLKA